MEQKNIVVLAHPDWIKDYESNTKQIVHEFIRQHKVLYVQAPASRLSLINNKQHPAIQKRISVLKKEISPLLQLQNNLWTLIPDFKEEPLIFSFNNWSYKYINKINSQRLAKAIKDATQEIGFSDFILFNDRNPLLGANLKELIKPEKYIHNLSHFSFAEVNEQIVEKHEWKVLKKADVVVTNSRYYQQYASKINKNTSFIGQGPDNSLPKNPQKQQSELQKLIGNNLPLIGTLARSIPTNMDLDILKDMLSERPKWNFVLLTHSEKQFKLYQHTKLESFSNFTLINCKSEAHKKSLLQELDVFLIPESLSAENIGKYPIYLDLLLSLGKPIVATRHIAHDTFAEHVYMATTSEEFIVKTEHALVEDNELLKSERMAFAGMHNWENTVNAIYQSIGFQESNNLVA